MLAFSLHVGEADTEESSLELAWKAEAAALARARQRRQQEDQIGH